MIGLTLAVLLVGPDDNLVLVGSLIKIGRMKMKISEALFTTANGLIALTYCLISCS